MAASGAETMENTSDVVMISEVRVANAICRAKAHAADKIRKQDAYQAWAERNELAATL